jgi:hypothetical protein
MQGSSLEKRQYGRRGIEIFASAEKSVSPGCCLTVALGYAISEIWDKKYEAYYVYWFKLLRI